MCSGGAAILKLTGREFRARCEDCFQVQEDDMNAISGLKLGIFLFLTTRRGTGGKIVSKIRPVDSVTADGPHAMSCSSHILPNINVCHGATGIIGY